MRASRITTAARRGRAWAADYAYAVRQIVAGVLRPSPGWAGTGATRGRQVPVLLIPGIYESWRFLEPLAERLLEAGHPVHVVRELGLNHRSVRSGADVVAAHLRTLAEHEVVLVAHSKGGLIGKQVLLDRVDGAASGAHAGAGGEQVGIDSAPADTGDVQLGTGDAPTRAERTLAGAGDLRAGAGGAPPDPRVLGLVAVNTPFQGSAYATYMPVRAVRDLSPRAVRALAEQRAVDALITSLYACWDPHIPGGSHLATARNVQVPAVGHFRILGDRRTQDAIVAAVRSYQA